MKFLETRGLRFTKCVPNFTTVAKVGLNYSIVYSCSMTRCGPLHSGGTIMSKAAELVGASAEPLVP